MPTTAMLRNRAQDKESPADHLRGESGEPEEAEPLLCPREKSWESGRGTNQLTVSIDVTAPIIESITRVDPPGRPWL